MAKIFFPRHVLFNKIDNTYGETHAFVAADALMAYNVSLTPLQADSVSDEGMAQNSFGAAIQYFVNKLSLIEFEVPFIGHANAGTPPKFSPSLRSCGLAETIVASTSVNYKPVTPGVDSVGFGFNIDNNFFQLLGARGDLTWSLAPNAYGFLKFSMTGLFTAPMNSAYSAPDFTGQQRAHIINDKTFKNFSVHGRSEIPRSIDFALGNAIETDPTMSTNEVVNGDRTCSGSMVIDAQSLASYNWFNHITNHTTGSINYQLGTTANQIVEISHQKTQLLSDIGLGEEKKYGTYNMNYNVLHDSTDEGVSITFK